MSKSRVDKAVSGLMIFRYVFILAACVLVGFIPAIMNRVRVEKVRSNLHAVYPNAEFTEVTCTKYNGSSQYMVHITDAAGNQASGFANSDGSMANDTYACYYYADDVVEYFNNGIGVEDFAGVGIAVDAVSYNNLRYEDTSLCTSFEAYLDPNTLVHNDGFSSQHVYISVRIVGCDDAQSLCETISDRMTEQGVMLNVHFEGPNGEYLGTYETDD